MGDAAGLLSAEEMRYYRIHKTLCKMLSKRGYNVTTLDNTPADFKNLIEEKANLTDACQMMVDKPEGGSMLVWFAGAGEKGLGTKAIKDFATKMIDAGTSHGILVYRNNITAIARQLLQPGAIPEVKIEVFKESELLVDITEHELVPEHVVLTSEQKQEVLARYKLKESQLPKIQQADPVARYFGLTRGQVVKIIRLSETAGRYVTYRVCV